MSGFWKSSTAMYRVQQLSNYVSRSSCLHRIVNILDCPNNCAKCSEASAKSSVCDVCMPGFVISADKKTCTGCGTNCLSCTSAGNCDPGQCKPGTTYKNSTKQCIGCGDGCDACDVNGEGKCDPGKCRRSYMFDASSNTCKGAPC
ncbi:hypothetical protein HELRODRAFT_158742 [Helobdella robusta]|uniref:Uncharacterized protein n=1 Tax=Helobdella robusta TaxID=6412 RepID=T1EN68_HELRO|nr:hypothetical protein HELRODRAFT_158742 [Helobdella robusta]ESO12263.1 hypothetical protein HELRODRAFT_158742 [Helobdella robusta]